MAANSASNEEPELVGGTASGERLSRHFHRRSLSKSLQIGIGVIAIIFLAIICLAFWDPDGMGRKGMEFPADVGRPIADTVKDGTKWLI